MNIINCQKVQAKKMVNKGKKGSKRVIRKKKLLLVTIKVDKGKGGGRRRRWIKKIPYCEYY